MGNCTFKQTNDLKYSVHSSLSNLFGSSRFDGLLSWTTDNFFIKHKSELVQVHSSQVDLLLCRRFLTNFQYTLETIVFKDKTELCWLLT